MGQTLVVAEKPSVGRDIAAALPGTFKASQDKTHLVGDDYVITWTVGHLVGLADPEEYDPKLKKWRYADLPIVPSKFKLVPNDAKAEKQLKAIHRLMRSDDIDVIVNACDAGREGELIFAYTYETSKSKKPVKRLWLSSMTRKAIQDAFQRLRDGDEMKDLESAARARSEADWIVGMNATRAATIRLRSAFDGAVSLGRVQTPTLALVVRRELEIRAFVPEPYWLVEARFGAEKGDYSGRYMGGKRLKEAAEAEKIVAETRDQPGTITKLEKKEEREQPNLLYDLTTLQRHANTLFGFSARRTLSAAQALYERHKAITYPRTNSKFLSGDLVPEIKPTAEMVGQNAPYRKGAEYVMSLASLPLQRVVNDARVTDHHAIIPTRSEHVLDKMSEDERKVYDLVAKRFLAIFHPDAVFERTRVETTVVEHIFRTSGRILVEAGWRGVYGEEIQSRDGGEDDTGGEQLLPPLGQGEGVKTLKVESLSKETQPPRRYTEASLLGAMEGAGKEITDDEMREAMKESGIGTPATRAAIIERLISVGYIEREGRALHATEKGVKVIELLGEHVITSAELTGDWERRLNKIEQGEDSRKKFIEDTSKFIDEIVKWLDGHLKDVKIERANLGPCPVCGRDIIENRKGYSCWSREDPGCGFVIWKNKAGKTLTATIVKELIESLRESIERGDQPPVGRTKAQVTGFRGRSGRSFRAKLMLVQNEEGKWRVDFDEDWAREPKATPPAEEDAAQPAEPEKVAAGVADESA
ncbi:MAG TPA: DNA topoisomerase 3 [Thermoleophilaceae bacterium]